jgi:Leucine-rich repeat (LRR) protein
LDQASGADQTGRWDVEYLCDAIPHFKCLRALDLRDLDLTASDGWDILKACSKCPSLKELDLSDNNLHELSDVLEYEDVVCHLHSLNLCNNALGDQDEDSVGCDVACHALATIITHYTSLRELDLNSNAMGNREGLTIAAALCECTHLQELNLTGNDWTDTVDTAIRAAWRGEAERLFL